VRIDVSIVTSGHDVADARIHRLCAAFTDAGLVVELLGLGDAASAPPGVATRVTPRSSMGGRATLAVRYAAAARGRVLLALDPDSLVTCLVVGRLRRRSVVADVHEDYVALVARVLVAGATWAACRADLAIVADDHVPPTRAGRRLVLRNVPYLGMLPEPSTPEDPPRALYVGDVRESRGLWAMVAAMEAAPAWSLDIVGPVSGADSPRLEDYLLHGPARDRIRTHGRIPPRDAWTLAKGAACGLVLLADTAAFRAAMPSKLYEYAACGLPVIVTDLPRQHDFVQGHGFGAIVPTGEASGPAAGRVLTAWLADPQAVAAMRERAEAWRAEARTWTAAYEQVAAEVRSLA
jgi:glycosyltransferase involved in cell wall biosynthesis